MARVFLSKVLQIASENDARVNQIAKEFKNYKQTGKYGTYFGRDADIGRPTSAREHELMHVHLFPSNLVVRGVPIRQYNRTSDIFLIYCEGIIDKTAFLLIDIIWNDAHQKLRNEKYIRDELVPAAEKFREAF